MKQKIDNYFGITKNNSSYKIEIIGGVTAFISMSYIIFVNPLILSQAGMDEMAVFAATAVGSAIATLIMGLYAKFPLALAPCMSMNAFFTYTVVLSNGFTWEQALACVFLSSILFIILSFSGQRQKMLNAIPNDLKCASTVGLGLFICTIGLKNAGIIIGDDNLIMSIGSFLDPNVIIAVSGIIALCILLVKNKKFIVVKSMLVSLITAYVIKVLAYTGIIDMTSEVYITLPYIDASSGILINPFIPIQAMVENTLFVGITHISEVLTISGLGVVLTFCFLDFFSTSATLNAATTQVTNISSDIEENSKIYVADAVGTMSGAILGTSNITTYIESVSGIVSGARTGFSAVIVAILFLLSLFLYPLLSMFTASVIAPALFAIGIFMFNNIGLINWDGGYEKTIPCFLTILLMPLSGSIILGLTIGFLFYTILMLCANKKGEITMPMYMISALSFIYLISITV